MYIHEHTTHTQLTYMPTNDTQIAGNSLIKESGSHFVANISDGQINETL